MGALGTKDIGLDQANAALEAAIKKAEEIGTTMDIAVVDVGGNLKAFARMDGAWLGSIDISQKKARTAPSLSPSEKVRRRTLASSPAKKGLRKRISPKRPSPARGRPRDAKRRSAASSNICG